MAWYTKRNFNGGTVLLEQNITDNNELESFTSENFKELAKEYPNSENGKVYLIKYFVDDAAYYQLGGMGKLEALSRPAGRTAATGVDVSEALFSQKTAKGKRNIIYQEIEKDLYQTEKKFIDKELQSLNKRELLDLETAGIEALLIDLKVGPSNEKKRNPGIKHN